LSFSLSVSPGTANASAWSFVLECYGAEDQRRGKEKAMSEKFKTVGAYIVALSILMFAWSVFKTWEPPIQGRGAVATLEMSPPVNTVTPTQVAAE
jgi:hypothetical protein